MKKMIIWTMVCLFVAGGLVDCKGIAEKNNYEKATRLVQELKDSDDDGDGNYSSMQPHGVCGYKVEFLRSWEDDIEDMETYVIGF